MTCPGRSAARSEAKWCAADPGSRGATWKLGPGSAVHRFALHRIRDKPALLRARQQRRDPARGDAAVAPLRPVAGNLQILLAVALGREVLGRDLEALAQHQCDRF